MPASKLNGDSERQNSRYLRVVPRSQVRRSLSKLKQTALASSMWRTVRVLDDLIVGLASKSTLISSIYCVFISRKFRRECKAVLSGRHQYNRNLRHPGSGNALLRRNVHRLEKGLLAPDRREVFATDYIGETVEALQKLVSRSDPKSGVDASEMQWWFDVCERYFETVSGHPTVDAARKKYMQIVRPTRASERPSVPYKATQRAKLPEQAFKTLHRIAERRKSVRHFEQKPVPRGIIDRAIEVASLAPSACNRQPIHFRVFDDPEMNRRVASIPMGTNGFYENVPVFVVIVGSLANFCAERDRHVIYVDGGLAAMSLVMALEAQGVATCCINWPDIEGRERMMTQALGLRSDERPVMCLAVGFPHPDALVAKIPGCLEEFQQVIIEIKGTGTHNVGAELMTIAICQFLRKNFPEARVVADFRFGSRVKMSQYELSPMAPARHGWIFRVPLIARRVFGFTNPDEVSVVLDASCFAYSSQCGWGKGSLASMALRCTKMAARGGRIIFMPQAFGPFDNPEDQEAFRTIMKHASFIFARDSQSYDYIHQLKEDMANVRISPDFTVSVAHPSAPSPKGSPIPLIVPNHRMLDHNPKRDLYVPFLVDCIKYLRDRGQTPAILLHDMEEDRRILPELFGSLGATLSVIQDSDPIALKSILGQASLVIGSRFHALVGSLSQSVPTIGAGWSHKYQELFGDFDCSNYLLGIDAPRDLLHQRIDELLDPVTRPHIIQRLVVGASSYRKAADHMWQDVAMIIRGEASSLRYAV